MTRDGGVHYTYMACSNPYREADVVCLSYCSLAFCSTEVVFSPDQRPVIHNVQDVKPRARHMEESAGKSRKHLARVNSRHENAFCQRGTILVRGVQKIDGSTRLPKEAKR